MEFGTKHSAQLLQLFLPIKCLQVRTRCGRASFQSGGNLAWQQDSTDLNSLKTLLIYLAELQSGVFTSLFKFYRAP